MVEGLRVIEGFAGALRRCFAGTSKGERDIAVTLVRWFAVTLGREVHRSISPAVQPFSDPALGRKPAPLPLYTFYHGQHPLSLLSCPAIARAPRSFAS